MSDKRTESTELGRQARLMLAVTKALREVLESVTAPELMPPHPDYPHRPTVWRERVNEAMDEMIKAVVTAPGVRVTVFTDKEPEAK